LNLGLSELVFLCEVIILKGWVIGNTTRWYIAEEFDVSSQAITAAVNSSDETP
jgi:hypothetical protein